VNAFSTRREHVDIYDEVINIDVMIYASMESNKPLVTKLKYPTGRFIKKFYHLPIPMWRLGLRRLYYRRVMILATYGNKTGQVRYTPLEYHKVSGRKYFYSGWGDRSAWYRNIQANPYATIQSADGVEHVSVRRVTNPRELRQVFEYFQNNLWLKLWLDWLGLKIIPDSATIQPGQIYLFTYEVTDQSTPLPIKTDMTWIWQVFLLIILVAWLIIRNLK
jgi:deazaflavin-dependent oxidoreductase (nitroreductase family)